MLGGLIFPFWPCRFCSDWEVNWWGLGRLGGIWWGWIGASISKDVGVRPKLYHMRKENFLPVSLIIAVLGVSGLVATNGYLASAHDATETGIEYVTREVPAAPALQQDPVARQLLDPQTLAEFSGQVTAKVAAEVQEYRVFDGSVAQGDGIVISNGVADYYENTGGADGFLGAPLTSTVYLPGQNATITVFEQGLVYSGPSTGIHAVAGDNLIKYFLLNLHQGPLGLPTSGLEELGDGFVQAFQQSTYLVSSPETGVHYIGGNIYHFWENHGGPENFGFPVSDVIDVSGQVPGADRGVAFSADRAIVSSSITGVARELEQ